MSVFQVAVLASGSKGNATLVRCSSGMVLIDMGVSCRRITQGMKALGLAPEDLDGVFFTHEHTDHVKGIVTFAKKYEVPLYASKGTWEGIRQSVRGFDLQGTNWNLMPRSVELDSLTVRGFAISHDAREPLGYALELGEHKFVYLTDTGFVSDPVRRELDGAEVMVLEANHDVDMLRNGSYPVALKTRILGVNGHLANEMTAEVILGMERKPREVFLAHLSQENNTPHKALATVQGKVLRHAPEADIRFYIAKQDETVMNQEWGDAIEQNIFE